MNLVAHKFSRDRLNKIEPGQRFIANGKEYVMQGSLGDGAIGVVRRAKCIETGRMVVVKFLAPETKYIDLASMEDIHRRFQREGQRGKELFDENLVEVIAYEENEQGKNFVGESDDMPINPFIVMEFAGNRTLEGYIRKDKGVPPKQFNINKETLYIAHEIAKGLSYLHKRGNVHRDVKPANIFLTKDSLPKVKIGDFGIVKWSDFRTTISSGTLTTTGQHGLGTIKYMPPEQSLNPKEVTVQSDMYSFGITLYELFTNQILPDVHHVFLLREVRLERTTLERRLYNLGLGMFPPGLRGYEHLFEKILDTTLKVGGRPTSTKFEGMLQMLHSHVDAS